MPTVNVNGVDLFYDLAGPKGLPTVVFSNSLGSTIEMWDGVAAALAGRFRVLRYDTQGHGRSGSRDQPTTIDDLADDLAGLLDALDIRQAHVVGLSLGGMTAQAFAVLHPERTASLVLMATAAHLPPPDFWMQRAATVNDAGAGGGRRHHRAALVHPRLPGARPGRGAPHPRPFPRIGAPRLRPLLRGDRRHGPARDASGRSPRRRWSWSVPTTRSRRWRWAKTSARASRAPSWWSCPIAPT